MNILVIQPGFPAEIPLFVRGLARMGARVYGVGDQPPHALPATAKEGLSGYLHVQKLWDAGALIQQLRNWSIPVKLDRVECFWEVAMDLAAQVRQAFRIPGLDPETTRLFRNKDLMRRRLDEAGIRNPRHAAATTSAQIRQALEYTGYPAIIKPVSGAGSADTYRVDHPDEFQRILPRLRHIREVVVEEFVTGTEYTFDTITVNGKILFYNVELYRPDMLTARSQEQISPMTISLRDLDQPHFHAALRMSQSVITALGFQTGFTHMEWFHTPSGEVVFGEIAGRPPGGDSGELMNYTCDFDVYNAYAEAVTKGRISQNIGRKYNVAVVFKRAQGQGKIQSIEGLNELAKRYRPHILREELLRPGAKRRDWKQTLLSDGFVILRHPDLDKTLEMADFVANHVRLRAGTG
ncbi:ATP-grasp domain-containing protein [Sulfidibacter corallicola]|uniref:ATP-grasp domain-containing protein n=1 Tax=Sulfidibacter corallicola TaxID=2818388 RepID=A0A8A4TSN7_SULCO|nr:ATP-grasp domain-containing protein [Sulfidibacter corallicola]QTD52407.1 ATP-grasp domain-containing protein [Sulfidibacter corallicola]